MDNVTHSLAGLVIAEAALRLRARLGEAEPSPRARSVAALSSMVVANLPDADLFYTGLGGDRLAYMLHHRGYTHTVPAALLGALLAWGVVWLLLRWRGGSAPSRADARWLCGLLVVSALSHLVLDWTNSYGVHPWWPFDDRWIYGDAVFIVEPWLWVVSVPMLVAATRSRVARVLLSLVLVVGLALAWRVSLVSTAAAASLTAGAVLVVLLARVTSAGTRALVAVTGWVLVTLVMAAGSASARAATIRAVRVADPRADLLDVVVSPLPANALCMSVVTVERSGASYRVVTARASAAPWVAAARCGVRDRPRAGFASSSRRSTSNVQWDGEWSAPVAELATLARESCPALAALRFIRAPLWRALDDSTVMLGDARYGDASGGGFTDVRVPRRSSRCPASVPPWTPPRADLIGAGR